MQYGREYEAEEDGGKVLDPENDDFVTLFSTNRDLGKQFAALLVATVTTVVLILSIDIVSCGQTLFHTEGKGLGFGHRETCRPAPWSAYQSQHSIQSHDT